MWGRRRGGERDDDDGSCEWEQCYPRSRCEGEPQRHRDSTAPGADHEARRDTRTRVTSAAAVMGGGDTTASGGRVGGERVSAERAGPVVGRQESHRVVFSRAAARDVEVQVCSACLSVGQRDGGEQAWSEEDEMGCRVDLLLLLFSLSFFFACRQRDGQLPRLKTRSSTSVDRARWTSGQLASLSLSAR